MDGDWNVRVTVGDGVRIIPIALDSNGAPVRIRAVESRYREPPSGVSVDASGPVRATSFGGATRFARVNGQ